MFLEIAAIAICLGLLFALSLVEAAAVQSSPLVLRAMAERDEEKLPPLLAMMLEDETQLMVPLRLGTQVTLITTAVLTAHLSLREWGDWGLGAAFLIIFVVSALFRQLVPGLLTQNNPEKRLVRLLSVCEPLIGLLRSFAFPLSSVLNRYRRTGEKPGDAAEQQPAEASEEEIQAYLDIGEDEGIIEEEDSRLIQSVVEFGDTLVREVMTPRTDIVACDEGATIGELREVMVKNRHSRIPIYRENLDTILGIAYIRLLLAHYLPGREADPIAPLIHPALFIPETKRVSDLLKEMQRRGDQAAIVIDEFGGVAGLVTMEDLLEEIVGEIRDEDQVEGGEVIEQGTRSYLMRGSTDLHKLEELAGRRFEQKDSATVSGMILTFLGRVPAPGEEFEMEGLKVRILEADRRRVNRLSIQL